MISGTSGHFYHNLRKYTKEGSAHHLVRRVGVRAGLKQRGHELGRRAEVERRVALCVRHVRIRSSRDQGHHQLGRLGRLERRQAGL